MDTPVRCDGYQGSCEGGPLAELVTWSPAFDKWLCPRCREAETNALLGPADAGAECYAQSMNEGTMLAMNLADNADAANPAIGLTLSYDAVVRAMSDIELAGNHYAGTAAPYVPMAYYAPYSVMPPCWQEPAPEPPAVPGVFRIHLAYWPLVAAAFGASAGLVKSGIYYWPLLCWLPVFGSVALLFVVNRRRLRRYEFQVALWRVRLAEHTHRMIREASEAAHAMLSAEEGEWGDPGAV